MGVPGVKLRSVFEQLLQVDVLRGPHSTGLCVVSDKRVYTHKTLDLPTAVVTSPRYNNRVVHQDFNNYVYMGHNRFATKGAINKRNAHPFQHGHITGMHNGTLWQNVSNAKGIKFNTDSESIVYSISEIGLEKTWERVQCSGAAALLWWDSKDKSLNIITNGKRPLFFGSPEDDSMLLVASELWMLKGIALRNNVKLKNTYKPSEHAHFRFTYDRKLRTVSNSFKLYKPKYEAPPPRQHNSVGFQGHGNYGRPDWFGRQTPSDPSLVWDVKENKFVPRDYKKCTSLVPAKTVEPIRPFKKPNTKVTDKTISEEQFKERYTNCCFCYDDISEDYVGSAILDDDNAVCPGCLITLDSNDMDAEATARAMK